MSKSEKIVTLYERKNRTGHFEGDTIYYVQPKAEMPEKETVDMDNFIPINEALKKLNGKRELTSDEVETYYDFASGIDNKGEIPYNRSAECQDLAMLSEHIANKQNDIRKEISKAQEEAQIRNEIAQSYSQNDIK